MDSLLDNARTYINILRNSSSAKVAEWKQEDFERAVNWAEYFKRVLVRLGRKPTVVEKFNVQLKEISVQSSERKYEQPLITAEFLGNSIDYLLKNLLGNPCLSHELRDLVKKKYHYEEDDRNEAPDKSLTIIHKRLTEQAQQENGLELILESLATGNYQELSTTTSESPSFTDVAILQWLEKYLEQSSQLHPTSPAKTSGSLTQDETNKSVSEKFWNLPAELLARTAIQSVNFFRLFYKLLALRVNHLQSDLLDEYKENCHMDPKLYLERMREVTVDLVESQIKRTASKTLAIGWSVNRDKSEASKTGTKPLNLTSPLPPPRPPLPINLWRIILETIDD